MTLIWEYLPGLWSLLLFFLAASFIPEILSWVRILYFVQKLPGPKGHFILGQAQNFKLESLFLRASEWRAKFPNFHKVFLCFYPLVFIQSPDAVQVILGRQKHAEKGSVYKTLKPLLGDGLVTSKGEKWFAHRKFITPTFHFKILENFVDVFVSHTEAFMDRLEDMEKDGFIDVCPLLRKLTLDFICETAMGMSTESTFSRGKRAEIIHSVHRLEAMAMYRIFRPWFLVSNTIFKLTKKGRDQDKYKKILETYTDEIIEERRKIIKTQKSDDTFNTKRRAIFIDLLIESNNNGQGLTNQDIREEVITFIMAGQNTTQLAIAFCLYLLGLNVDAQEKVHEETMEIFGTSDRNPTIHDLKEMKYLEMCIKETLRLYPVFPLIARKLTEDQKIGKYLLPKGVDVVILPYELHRNPENFPKPEIFNPDNFLPEKVQERHPYAYIPFSAGPRNCIGQKYAMLAIKTVISTVIRKYKITSKDQREEMKLSLSTVLYPKNGIKLKLIDRNMK